MSRIIILDTDVASFVVDKKWPIEDYLPHLVGKELAVSFMTVAEMYRGAYHRRWGARRIEQLRRDVDDFLVFHSDLATCIEWANIRHERRRRTITDNDAWIAATARVRGLPLVTHNARDFRDIAGLTVITESDH